jgi:hypothetical protein
MYPVFGIQSKVRAFGPMIGLLMLSACGGISLGGRPGACIPGTAQIEIYDTGMRRGCGCVEPGNQFFPSPPQSNPMTCTVNINTVLFFTYVGINNAHQISVQGNGQFSNTFPSRGVGDNGFVDKVTMGQTGTFSVVDIGNNFFASIVVQ